MPTAAGGAIEAIIIFAGASLLLVNAGFRRTILAAPRVMLVTMAAVFAVWFTSQIGEIETATYPLMSWHMYGESLRDAPMEGFRLQGVDCRGTPRRIPWSGNALGHRPMLSSGLQFTYLAYLTADSLHSSSVTAERATMDSLLNSVLVALNSAEEVHVDREKRIPERTPLCRLELQRMSVGAAEALHHPLPPYETVWAIDRH